MATLASVIQRGTLAARPAATAVAAGVLYFDTTNSIMYRSTGAAWESVEGGGGGGASWTQIINEDGSSFANWTTVDGTWASNGTIIQKTGSNEAAHRRAYYSAAKIPWGFPWIAEMETRVPTAGSGGGTVQAGMLIGYGVGVSGSMRPQIGIGSTAMIDADDLGLRKGWTATLVVDTWYKIRVVSVGGYASYYLDGTLMGTLGTGPVDWQATADYFGLVNYNAKPDYRSIKVWVMTGGVPA